MNVYLGQNITINCNYPEEYGRNTKYLDSVDDDSIIKEILDTNTKFQNDRFSISDDRSAKVLSVNISDVREDDEVFYLFGAWNGGGSVEYYTFFIEMWLHPTVAISVCVCAALLLIGGFVLMSYKLMHKKTQS
ncbi:uncharacterized protein Hap1MRO34_024221 [Clarias gariepinus]